MNEQTSTVRQRRRRGTCGARGNAGGLAVAISVLLTHEWRDMSTRCLTLSLLLLALPALSACGGKEASSAPPALSAAAMAAVVTKPGVSREALARRIDALFADAESGETQALLVFHGGRIVAERYGAGYGRETRFAGWSMTKSMTGVLIGLLVSDGRLRLDEMRRSLRGSGPAIPAER